jgi:hypothetical protein
MVCVFHLDAVAVAYIEVSAAFDYQFGALDRKQDELGEILNVLGYANVVPYDGRRVHDSIILATHLGMRQNLIYSFSME